MSFRAFVAYETEDGTYDLYHSHNGADNYQLKPFLEGYLQGKMPKDAGSLPDMPPAQVLEAAAAAERGGGPDVEFEFQDRDLIESEPVQTGVKEEEIGSYIGFYTHEVGYIVRDWEVEVYIPILASPIVLNTMRLRMEVEIYNANRVGGLQGIDRIEDMEPMYTLDEDDFTPEGISNLDEDVQKLLADRHVYLLDNYQRTMLNDRGDIGVFTADKHIVKVKPLVEEPLKIDVGVFIRVPWVDGQPKYPWSDLGNTHPATKASRQRWEMSLDFDETGRAATNQDDGARMQQELMRATLEFFMQLYSEFGDDLTSEFVPAKYQKLIEEAKQAYDGREEAD